MEKYFFNFSLNIKELRKIYGYTQKQVAEKLGITHQSYQAYEKRKALPSLPIFIALAELYDVTLDSLLGRE